MNSDILEGVSKAWELIAAGDATLIEITLRSIYVSTSATLLAAAWGLPIAAATAMRDFWGKRALTSLFNALLGLPTVALGLVLYLAFSRSGPLGSLELLYTPTCIIIGQALLVTPIMVSFTISALGMVGREVRDLARTLGASEGKASLAVLREAVSEVTLAVIACFNRAIAELGIALMVGGNIRGLTRVLTTTIALETTRGEIALSIALTLILLLIVFALSITVNLIRRS
ncbi:MAG: ABC transporter permease [Candidatus Bathyarchaeia archaeon]